MSDFRRRLMRQGEIPYQQIEYLQSDSSAYIDTGIGGGSDDLEIECVFEYNTHVTYGAIYGSYIDETTNNTRCILSEKHNTAYDCLNTTPTNGSSRVTIAINTKIHYTSNFYQINNGKEIVKRTINKGNSNNNNIALFNRSVPNPNTSRNIGLKIYSFKISKNGEMLRDFVPVRVGNIGYMYDKVSKQLFGNIGSGQFILGQDI